ncbi:MAG: hypothetical protein J6U10_07045, partial [Lachnospiraceae bacterium]|nr:hypothetical protein [Lachnospiraceae bacterium]
IGVGYTYSSSSTYKNYWVQMFGGKLTEPDTQNTDNILTARITLKDSAGEHTLTNSGQVRENSSAAMLPVESVPAFGSDNEQLASLVSMTQTDSLGALAGSGTGLTPVDASRVGMIAANETTANVLTNRKKVA